MRETPYFKEKLETIEVKNKSISQLLAEMAKTGFQGKKLGEAAEVWEEMIKDDNLTIFMGYAGSLSTTGMWKIICWLIENRYIDVLVSTGANISEDILEAMGGTYWRGSHLVDDHDLLRHKIDRFYDVYADELEYRKMENLIGEFMTELNEDHNYSSREFLHLFGKWLSKRGIKCIVSTAYEYKVPIFCPAIVDSGYGIAAVTTAAKGKNIKVDQMEDFREFLKIGDKSSKTGVIYIGGGVPKDFTQLLAVAVDLTRGGEEAYPHTYAIQITTDSPRWGGLSGCTFEEAISWGKTSATGKNVACYCDATIALPLLAHALNERVKFERKCPDFSRLFEK
ncbi:MAG TPA: deoxyhypusine synthase [Hadesarchaea archaeon]|nr:deoxyhypusine synthase [Hadesarchaea archaeon]